MRPYDRTNRTDWAWQAAVSARAREFIPEFLSEVPDSCATTRDILNRFKRENLKLCDDTIARSASNPQPKWQHCVASALSNLKVRGVLVSHGRGMWCLASVAQFKGSVQPPDVTPTPVAEPVLEAITETKRTENILDTAIPDTENWNTENLQSEVTRLKAQLASQQSTIASLNKKIDNLPISLPEDDTEDDIIQYLQERVLKLEPGEFERLVGEYLKSKGFSNVVVSGRSHDGGIDGECGIPFINVKVAFQAKRYTAANSIGIEPVQRLQGSMTGRFDRGIFITTSDYTSAARGWVEEVQAQITLINGDELMKEMIDLGLGVKAVTVVKHEVDEGFFANLENI